MTRLRIIHIFVVSLLLLELGVYLSYAAIPGQETVEVDRSDLQVSKTVAESYHADHNRAEDMTVNALTDDSCISQPNQTSCVNYKLPNVESDVEMLCEHMPHMAGCSVDNMCQSHGGHLNPSVYCSPFSILKDICSGEMATMSGCTNYTKMCGPVNSVVKECATQSLPLPSDAQLSQWISQICKSMPMTNCKQCGLNTRRSTRRSTTMTGTLNCDLLLVYSELCLSMPDMSQCTGWSQLCQIIPDWPLCPGGDDDEAPIMRMYFHASIADYVLLEQWVPRNWWEYLATFFAIIVMGILYEGLKTVRSVLEERWTAEGREGNLGDNGGSIQDLTGGGEEDTHLHHHGGRMKWKFDWVPFRWWVDIPRACFIFVEVGAGLILMLVAMTFNVGLFLAVCCGAFFGSLIFGRLSAKFTKALCH